MRQITDTLFIIPARGGSKGLPGKNILIINGSPLICYTIDAARKICSDEHICVSTDDARIMEVVENYGLNIPFKRPESLSTDNTSTWDVVKHALHYYENIGRTYKRICLLQPTSPLRNSKHIEECFRLWHSELEMIVSVKKSKSAAVICSENDDGYLSLTLNKGAKRRQDIADFYEYNGAIYLLDVNSFKQKQITEFTKIKKYVMSEESSVDIDNIFDFEIVKIIMKSKI